MRIFINRIAELIVKNLEGNLSTAEKHELDEWAGRSDKEQALFKQLTDPRYVSEQLEKFYSYDATAGWEKILSQYPMQQSPVVTMKAGISWKRWAVAAALVLAAGSGIYFILSGKKIRGSSASAITTVQHDVQAPKVTKATIVLGNGKTVALDSIANGLLASQDNINITKTNDGRIVYDASRAVQEEMQYNTLTNPRGSKVISLTLTDGTRVWLNSESSLRYPVAFAGEKREVEITGEAYFEVTRVPGKKFYVKSGAATTEVLGTHFNINAYSDEQNITVTLLEGLVKISGENGHDFLKPGQQAQVADRIKVVNNVNVEEVIAWKNEMFSFDGADIHSIMRQVERWYDVNVVLRDKITEKFYGDISRNVNVSSLFKMLETTGAVHFKIDGKKIDVMN